MATGWWGGITSIAKEVLTEGTEEIDDHATALQVEQKRTSELQAQNSAVKGENEMLKSKLTELNDSLQSSELQISAVSVEYRGLLQDKEEEVKTLKQTIEELNESNKSLLSSSSASGVRDRGHFHHFNRPDHSNGDLLEETEDITDILSHQQEINRLNAELERARAETVHWKREVKRASTPQEVSDTPVTGLGRWTASPETQQGVGRQTAESGRDQERDAFQQQIQVLERKLVEESDKHQQQLTALEQVHQQRVTQLQQNLEEKIRNELAERSAVVTNTPEEDEETAEELRDRLQQLEEEARSLYDLLKKRETELSDAKQEIEEYARKAQHDQNFYKKQLHETEEDKLASLRCVHGTLSHVQRREREKKLKLRLAASEQQEQAADLSGKLEASERALEESRNECEGYRREVAELTAESSQLNQSLTELDRDHEVVVGQLIEQRDELKLKNASLSETICELEAQNEETARQVKRQLTSEQEVSELQQQLVQSQQDLTAVREELNEANHVQADMGALKADLDLLCGQRSALEEEKEQLERRVEEINEQLQKSQAEVEVVSRKFVQSETAVNELNSEVIQSRERVAEIQEEFDQLETRNGELESDMMQARMTIEELKLQLGQSQRSLQEMTVSLDQSNLRIGEMQRELQLKEAEMQTQTDSDVSGFVSESDDGATTVYQSITEVTDLQATLTEVRHQLSSANKKVEDHDETISLLKQEITNLRQQSVQLEEQVSTLSSNICTKDEIVASLNTHIEQKEAECVRLLETNRCLAGEVQEKTTLLDEVTSELSSQRELARESSDLSSAVAKLTDELATYKLDCEKMRAVLESNDADMNSLRSQLAASEGMRAKAEAEVTELTALLAAASDRSIDSEPADPEPSEEDLQSPRGSTTSLSDVQELKTQLAELQELLAQKVLLINELQDDREDVGFGESVELKATKEQLDKSEALLAEVAEEKVGLQAQIEQLVREKTEIIGKKDSELEHIRAELTTLLQEVEKAKQLEIKLADMERKCASSEQLAESQRVARETAEAMLAESQAEVKKLSQELRLAEGTSDTNAQLVCNLTTKDKQITDLGNDLVAKDKQITVLQDTLDNFETTISSLKMTLQENEDNFMVLQQQVDEQEAVLLTTNETLKSKEQQLTQLLARENDAAEQMVQLQSAVDGHLATISSVSNDMAEKEARIEALNSQLTQELTVIAELREKMQERESVISDLNKQLQEKELINTSSASSNQAVNNSASWADPSILAEQLRSMEVEREQMSGVLGEKSREISNLKKQLHSLMDMNSSRDVKDAETAEMTKNTIRKLSSIVNERDVEIEALKQKNDSLVSILQAPGGGTVNGPDSPQQISRLLEERQALAQQVAVVQAEREQLLSALQMKHQEAVTFHGEAVRLAALVKEGGTTATVADSGEVKKLRAEFHERKQQLVETQHKLSEYKQKVSELSTQLESASRSDNVPKTAYDGVKQEVEGLRSRLEKQKEALLEKDRTYEDMQLRLSSQSESLSLAQTECNSLRKQIENLTFELSETRAERDDKVEGNEKVQAQLQQQDGTIRSLRSAELELQRRLQERERELSQLSSQVTSVGSDSDVEKTKLRQNISTLTSERDSAHITAQQNYQACQDLQAQLSSSQDRVLKLEREVERLRSHLVSIEEGYTADLIQSEEREKELRNRLASAEEKAAHTTTAVQHASLEASKQISSLEEQLHSVASQRDECMLQLSSAQEQCTQYSTQLANLQTVLEQFQTEKDSMHAVEVQRLQTTITDQTAAINSLRSQLAQLQGQVDSQTEALEAAQRLSEQLERKEETMNALRDEVSLREKSLREAEERIRRLSTNNESKVEKLLVKNLIVNWHCAPTGKKPEVLTLIARVLSFTEDEKNRVGLGERQGWIGGFWQKLAHPAPHSSANLDHSFSEMFVKFLESESSPQPAPLPLPVDRMVEEEKQRAEQHHRAAFNPFVAPTGATATRNQSHPLVVGAPRDGSPLYNSGNPLTPGNPLTAPLTAPVSSRGLSPAGSILTAGQLSSQTSPMSTSTPTVALTAPVTSASSLTTVGSNVRFIPIPTNSSPAS